MAKRYADPEKDGSPLAEMQKKALPRLEEARQERTHIETYVNDALFYARPGGRLMGEKRTTPVDTGAQNQLYDSEYQVAVTESASELKSIYTPHKRPWAKLKPREALDPDLAKHPDFIALVHRETAKLFEAIRMTRLDTILDTALEDWLITAGGLQINKAPGGRTTMVALWPLPEMYLEGCEELPTGVDARYRISDVKRRHLKMRLPMVDWEEKLKERKQASSAKNGEETYEIAYGYRYDGDGWPAERWHFDVFLESKLVHNQVVLGEGAVGLLPFRSAENSPSPWGRGPASIALSPARALDQIAYLLMKVLPKRVDPAIWHTQDGVFNAQGGIMAGDYVPVGPQFQMGPIESAHGMEDVIPEIERLIYMVRRPLWQDRPDPYEAGTTPPTAYQIQTDELGRAIRQERPRARFSPELVIPVLQRFIRIESDAGRMAPLKIDGKESPIVLEPESPMGRAADLEEVQHAQMLLSLIAGTLGDHGLMSIDARTTIENLKAKIGDTIVELGDPMDAAAQEALTQGAGAAGAAAGDVAGQAAGVQLAA